MKRLVILGGGESGCGTALLAKMKGFDVFLSDIGKLEVKYHELLTSHDIAFEEGRHTEKNILSADEVVKSPGIPDSVPIIKSLRDKCIPVISEIEFAGRYTRAKTVCVTGSNGKTTTTTLIHKILNDAGYNVGLAGNIGESFAFQVADSEKDWYVLELSSFQLDGMEQFKADIAVLMNITPDHLDRYDYNMQKYADSKMGIMRNQGHDDYFIYNLDDRNIKEKLTGPEPGMRLLPFSISLTEKEFPVMNHSGWHGSRLEKREIYANADDKKLLIPIDELKIKGKHNIYNTMAASLAALAAGVDPTSIRKSVTNFVGVEHRLEQVGEFRGVLYINDSKATNVDSVWYALESMDRPVVWIAGGTDKGNDYSALGHIASEKIKTLVCLGRDTEKIKDFFTGIIPEIYQTASLDEAMKMAVKSADEGDTVLLSPACASFDLFRNYEDRGNQFKEWIKDSLDKKG